MAKNPSVELYLRTLEQHMTDFKQSLEALIAIVSQDGPAKKQSACNELLRRLDVIKKCLTPPDYPKWLVPLEKELNVYSNSYEQPNAGPRLLKAIIQHYRSIGEHRWVFEKSEESESPNFDEEYKKAYEESRAHEAFETLLKILQNMVDSGYIDSLEALNALNRLIKTIKTNMMGSYISTKGAFLFTKTFFKNYVKALGKRYKRNQRVGCCF